jgi:hypothetical protein
VALRIRSPGSRGAYSLAFPWWPTVACRVFVPGTVAGTATVWYFPCPKRTISRYEPILDARPRSCQALRGISGRACPAAACRVRRAAYTCCVRHRCEPPTRSWCPTRQRRTRQHCRAAAIVRHGEDRAGGHTLHTSYDRRGLARSAPQAGLLTSRAAQTLRLLPRSCTDMVCPTRVLTRPAPAYRLSSLDAGLAADREIMP